MIFLIVLLAILGLMLFTFLKPKPTDQIIYTKNLDSHDLTTKGSYSEAEKND